MCVLHLFTLQYPAAGHRVWLDKHRVAEAFTSQKLAKCYQNQGLISGFISCLALSGNTDEKCHHSMSGTQTMRGKTLAALEKQHYLIQERGLVRVSTDG